MSEQTKVTIGGNERTVPVLNGVRALESLRLINEIMQVAPDVMRKRAAFIKKYGEDNAQVLNRGEVRVKFPPRPVFNTQTGDPVLDENGQVRLIDPLARISEHDWASMNNSYVIKPEPSDIEVGLVMVQDVLNKALVPFTQLLGLLMAKNDEVLTHMFNESDLDDWLEKEGRKILHDADIDELIELVIVAIEVSNNRVKKKLEKMGDRVGNVLSVFGLKGRLGAQDQASIPNSMPSTDSPLTSSTDSQQNTTGTNDRSSELAGAPS
jgi:hypothetical protein